MSLFENEIDVPCVVCGEADDEAGNEVVICDACERCFHQQCCTVPLKTVPRGKWYCEKCMDPDESSLLRQKQTRRVFDIFEKETTGRWVADPYKGRAVVPRFDKTIFSPQGAVATRWFADLVKSSGGGEACREACRDMIGFKMETLINNIYMNSNFMSNHRSTLTAWAGWCREPGNYAMDSAIKAAQFLRWYARGVARNRKDSLVTERVKTAETEFNAYRNAVAALEKLAEWQGFEEFSHGLSKKEAVRSVATELQRAYNAARNAVHDFQATSRHTTKTVTAKNATDMIEAIWAGKTVAEYATATGADAAQMRQLLNHCNLNTAGRRSGDEINIRCAMMLMHELSGIGPAKGIGIGASLRVVKERVNADETMLQWMRHRDRLVCAVGALAVYLVWLNDIDGRIGLLAQIRDDLERQSEFERDEGRGYEAKWWSYYLVFSENPEAAISSKTHCKDTHLIQEAAGIRKTMTARTQMYRSNVAIGLIEKGVDIQDVSMYQGWLHTTATDVYVRSAFKTGPLSQACGWEGPRDFECWWESTDADIPRVLLDRVFPGLDEIAALAESRYKEFGLDLSAVMFTSLLKYLRRVFLEDAVAKRGRFPNFPAYRHAVFLEAMWASYAEAETARVEARQQLYETRRSNPELFKKMEREFEVRMAPLLQRIADLEKTAAPSAAAAAAAPCIQQILVLKDNDIRNAYMDWCGGKREWFAKNSGRIPWKETFGATAIAHKKRYAHMRPWLEYMDTLLEIRDPDSGTLAYERDSVLDKMVQMAANVGKPHSVFIKNAFYYMVRPMSAAATSQPAVSREKMLTLMMAAGLPLLS
jgi:hypothetical protein